MISYFRKIWKLLVLGTILILIFGIIGIIYQRQNLRASFVENLKQSVNSLSIMVDPSLINKLPIQSSDTNLPEYDKIRNQFKGMESVFIAESVRGFYLMRLDTSNNVIFLVDSADIADPWHSEPGVVYENPPPNLATIFAGTSGQQFVGPYTDEYGSYYTYLKPITDSNNKTIAVLAADYESSYIDGFLLKQSSYIIILVLFLLIIYYLFLALVSYYAETVHSAHEKEHLKREVEAKTKELVKKNNDLADQKKTILNVLEETERERNKAEELARIIRDIGEPIISSTPEGIISTWNHGAEELYGYTSEESIGQPLSLIIPRDKEEEKEKVIDGILKGKDVVRLQTVRKKKDGSLVEIYLSASPIHDANRKISGISFVAKDITKEKAIDKAKTEFVSLASHQLRTPLSAINWYTEMLMAGDAGKINKKQLNYLQEVYVGSQRMVNLINSLLNVSRLDLGVFVLNPKSVDVRDLIKDLLVEMTPQIKLKAEVIKESYGKNLPLFSADYNFLRMIIQNILSNAVKYTPPQGQILIEARIVKSGETYNNKIINDDKFCISISDSGIGISKNQQHRIFEKIFRADNAKKVDAEGTGLGLYLAKSIIDQSGGEIWFSSEENKGTTFVVAYPLTGMKKVTLND